MADYRFFLLDERDAIMGAQEAELADDAAAIAAACSIDHSHAISIWQHARKVADMTFEQRGAIVRSGASTPAAVQR